MISKSKEESKDQELIESSTFNNTEQDVRDPVHFINGLIYWKGFRFPPKNLHNDMPYDKTYFTTLTEMPLEAVPRP